MRRHLTGILLSSLTYFVVAMIIGIMAFGTDFDQLRSRTMISRTAAHVHDVLWWPHDAVLRSLPNDFVAHHTYVITIALVLNCLAWGAAIYLLTKVKIRSKGHYDPTI